nr:MAG: putative coat protein [Leviviridae sp.]
MIGSSWATSDLSSTIGDLPDATSHLTTFTLVNQDAYSSEYRFRGTDYDYVAKIRNTNESKRADGSLSTRHNAELTVTKRRDLGDPLSKDIVYVASLTVRFPQGGSADIMKVVAGHICNSIALSSSGARLQKMLNFES